VDECKRYVTISVQACMAVIMSAVVEYTTKELALP